jgi:hypothetical protein
MFILVFVFMPISHSNDNATHSAKVTKKKPMDCLSFAAVFFCRDGARSVCGGINATYVGEEYWKLLIGGVVGANNYSPLQNMRNHWLCGRDVS